MTSFLGKLPTPLDGKILTYQKLLEKVAKTIKMSGKNKIKYNLPKLLSLDEGVVFRILQSCETPNTKSVVPIRNIPNVLNYQIENIGEENFYGEKIAYGDLAIPILEQRLNQPDEDVQIAALVSLQQLLCDEDLVVVALERKVVQRIYSLLSSDNASLQEFSLKLLNSVCYLPMGIEAVISYEESVFPENTQTHEGSLVEHELPVGELAFFLSSPNIRLRYEATNILEKISHHSAGPRYLLHLNIAPILLERAKIETNSFILEDLLTILQAILIKYPKIGLSHCNMWLMINLLKDQRISIRTKAGLCLSILLSDSEGRDIAHYIRLMDILKNLIPQKTPEEIAVLLTCIKYLTIHTRARLRAAELNLTDYVLYYARDEGYWNIQLSAIQTLNNLAEVPSIREKLLKMHEEGSLGIIPHRNSACKEAYDILIRVLKWRP